MAGNPAKQISDVRTVKNKVTGELAYPWRHHFHRAMPWSDTNFEAWYASLDLSMKQYYGISGLAGDAL